MRIRRSYRYFKTNTQQQRNYKKWKKLTKNLLSELWKNYNFCKIHNSYYLKLR